jgi:hypothetical protein
MQTIIKKKIIHMNTMYKNSGHNQKTNVRIHRLKEGAEIQTKGIENLFNEIIAKSFPNLCSNIDIDIQDAFQTPSSHDQKRTTP